MSKRLSIYVLIIIISLSSTGCIIKSKADIEQRETVAILGIDSQGDDVRLTTVLIPITPIKGGESEIGKTTTYISYGSTIFDAIRNLHAYTDKDIIWGHMDFVIIGEDTAKEGLAPYLDIISRDHEIKQNSRLLIAKDSTALDFINTTSTKEQSIHEILLSLTGDVDALSESSNVSLLDYMQMISCDKGCLFIPYVSTGSYMVRDEGQKDKKDIVLSGYAVFDEDKLVGYLDDKMARGLNWVINEIATGIIVLRDKDGNKFSMEIVTSNSDIEIDFSSSMPTANIVIEFTTVMGEYHGDKDIFTSKMIDYITLEQNIYVKKEVSKTVEYLQSMGLDSMGICSAVYHKYPKKSQQYENKWQEIYSEMDITIEISSVMYRSYNLNQPITNKDKPK